MIRLTSRQVYTEIIQNGTVNNQERVILDFLHFQGANKTLKEISRGTDIEINAVSGRVNSLKKKLHKGVTVLKEFPKRKCAISGFSVTPVGINEIGQGELF